ncbi:hypothetical protein C1H46_001698 [Malus baccata]|uniref:Uncharacterized protein n=1 Tax=Malus baccata TaxID=106549 RepID=A0A540NNR2_MALBA|nr:hypothetical protein C1H46_001698 [Malus baccata]
MWTYYPITIGLPEVEDMLLIRHFRLGDNELEDGDQIRFGGGEEHFPGEGVRNPVCVRAGKTS